MWVKMTDSELVEESSVIVMAELIGETLVTLPTDEARLRLGVLQVAEFLKGDSHQMLLLLVLPAHKGLALSTDIDFHKGQRGLWFLEERAPGGGLYLANHPQRFLSEEGNADRIGTMRETIETLTDSQR